MSIDVDSNELTVHDTLGATVQLNTQNNSELATCVRSAIRVNIMKQLHARANVIDPITMKPKRKDMTQVPHYVDQDITNHLLKT